MENHYQEDMHYLRVRRRRYSGCGDRKVFFAWVRHMAYYFSQRDYDRYEQCQVAIECFTDYAEAWLYNLEDDLQRQRLRPIETWGTLVFYMTQYYAPGIDARAYARTVCSQSKPLLVVNTEHSQALSSQPVVTPQKDKLVNEIGRASCRERVYVLV